MNEGFVPLFKFLKTSRTRSISTADRIPDSNPANLGSRCVWCLLPKSWRRSRWSKNRLWRLQKGLAVASPCSPAEGNPLPLALATLRGRRILVCFNWISGWVRARENSYAALGATWQRSLTAIESLGARNLEPAPHPVSGSLDIYDWYRFTAHHELCRRQQVRDLVEIFHP
jgi:hypothetical protein